MITRHDLISQEYCESQKTMHANPRGYGSRGDHWAETVMHVATRYQAGSILDYGAGQGRLGIVLRANGFVCRDYDPAVAGMDGKPRFADLVNCTDVLEHIEPRKLDTVLTHIRSLARTVVVLVVATRPANKRLPNGKNAHLIVENEAWWEARVVAAGFTLEPPPTVLPAKFPRQCYMAVLKP